MREKARTDEVDSDLMGRVTQVRRGELTCRYALQSVLGGRSRHSECRVGKADVAGLTPVAAPKNPRSVHDILRPMNFRDRLRAGKVGVGRFAPLRGTMRKIGDHADLEKLRKAGVGFVVNIRPKQSKLHLVDCESVEVMKPSRYPKVFSETAHEALEWVITDSEGKPWEHCGLCGGARASGTES